MDGTQDRQCEGLANNTFLTDVFLVCEHSDYAGSSGSISTGFSNESKGILANALFGTFLIPKYLIAYEHK